MNAENAFDTLVLDQYAIPVLGSAILENSWFSRFEWPHTAAGVSRAVVGSTVYLLSQRADVDSKFIVIRVGHSGIFSSSLRPQYILDRLLHVALSTFERTVSIPVSWKPYNDGRLLSIYAQPESKGRDRLYFDRCPEDDHNNLYVYAVTDGFAVLGDVFADYPKYRRAVNGLADALVADSAPAQIDGADGITLGAPTGSTFIGSATLDQWYSKKLTREQRAFVDRGYDRPVRLRGAAGSGKTLSMAVKFLRDAYAAEDAGRNLRFAFITHSSAVAHETLPGMFEGLDPLWRWKSLTHASIWNGSLYELAQDLLQYDQKGLNPLSVDGREGRGLQAILILDVLSSLRKSTKFVLRDLAGCSDGFRGHVTAPLPDGRFISGLINEFACILDSENIRLGNKAADRYIRAGRERWQIPLPLPDDRRAVLIIHDEYRRALERSDLLSMDQMVADLNRYLQLHEWQRLRDRQGFDAVFVDELHYFNRSERMVFHSLFTPRAISAGRMPLFMAYDMKQSPTDVFLGYSEGESTATFFQRIGAGVSDLVELTRVFRYTPEISAFLRDLDCAFPALDLEGEWGAYNSTSALSSGEIPRLIEFGRTTELLDQVFSMAAADAVRDGGKNVAVLCMDEGLFDTYLNAGRIADKFIPLTGRDQVHELKYAGGRCVFSLPEYVAGLQFKTVYLIHFDRAELDEDADGTGSRRRFVSRAYLAASRASDKLVIASTLDRGGRSDVLNGPIDRGSLMVSN